MRTSARRRLRSNPGFSAGGSYDPSVYSSLIRDINSVTGFTEHYADYDTAIFQPETAIYVQFKTYLGKKQPAPAQVPARTPLEERFDALVMEWKDASGPSSSLDQMILHPAYLQIIGMGPSALPLLFRELQTDPDHWFAALFAITGVDAAAGHETFSGAVDAWLKWGAARGYFEREG